MRDRKPSRELAAFVKSRRVQAGLTQRQLALQSGISVGALRDIEQGRTGAPRSDSLAELATALGVDRRELTMLLRASDDAGDGPADGELHNNGHGVLEILILGRVSLFCGQERLALRSVREQAILGLLALQGDHGVSRSALVDALWGDESPAAAVGMVQGCISRLRRIGGRHLSSDILPIGGIIRWDGARYKFAVPVGTDVSEFRALVREARGAADKGLFDLSVTKFRHALLLWRGEPMAGVDVLGAHPWVTGLCQERIAAMIDFADAAIAGGSPEATLSELQTAARLEPLDERVHARLMGALVAAGQQAASLTVFENLRARLDQELGVQPGPELSEMHLRVLRQEIQTSAAVSPAADPPMTAELPGPSVPRQLPSDNGDFVGRSHELAVLDKMLSGVSSDLNATAIAVVSGPGGVGKTTLAVHWAHSAVKSFPDGQLYGNLQGFGTRSDPVPPEEVLCGFLVALGVPAREIPPGAQAQAGLYRTLLSGRRMLVLLDNARTEDQVRPLVPGSAGCAVLLTSRSRLSGLAAAEAATPVILDVLPAVDARMMLARRLGEQRVLEEPTAAADLADLCARLPLALSVAATKAAERPELRLEAVVADLRDEQNRLDALETGDAACGVRTVLSWSYDGLSADAARLFRLSAVHPGPDFTVASMASLAGVERSQARRLVAELVRASLLSEHGAERLSCHDLLRVYTAELSELHDPPDERSAALGRVLDYYLRGCAAVSSLAEPAWALDGLLEPAQGVQLESFADFGRGLEWLKSERHVLVAAADRAELSGFDTHAWQLGWAMDYPFFSQCWWHELRTVQHGSLRAADRTGDPRARAHALHGLGHALIEIGEAGEAGSHLRNAATIFADIGDETSHGFALHHLAVALSYEGRYMDAIRTAERARALLDIAGETNTATGVVNNIGWFRLHLGEHDHGLDDIRHAVQLFREQGDQRGEAIALDSLGTAHHLLGDESLALECLTKALRTVRASGDRRAEAEIHFNLGETHHALGQHDRARREWTLALHAVGEQRPGRASRIVERINSLS